MTTETHTDTTIETTLTASSGQTPVRKRKRTARHRNAAATQTAQDRGFKVPIGDSGEVVESAWYFGG